MVQEGRTAVPRFRDSTTSGWKDALPLQGDRDVMVTAGDRRRTQDDIEGQVPDQTAVLVRVRVDEADASWPPLPPVPTGAFVSYSASSPQVAARLSALEEHGYVFAGVHAPALRAAETDLLDLLVPTDLIEDEPEWWALLVAQAWRALPLLHGPVARVFADLVALHRTAHRRAATGRA
jgi:hypothetical protein